MIWTHQRATFCDHEEHLAGMEVSANRVRVTQNGYIGPHQTASFYLPKRRYGGLGRATNCYTGLGFAAFLSNVMSLNPGHEGEVERMHLLREYAA
jgi:hypothetical protein